MGHNFARRYASACCWNAAKRKLAQKYCMCHSNKLAVFIFVRESKQFNLVRNFGVKRKNASNRSARFDSNKENSPPINLFPLFTSDTFLFNWNVPFPIDRFTDRVYYYFQATAHILRSYSTHRHTDTMQSTMFCATPFFLLFYISARKNFFNFVSINHRLAPGCCVPPISFNCVCVAVAVKLISFVLLPWLQQPDTIPECDMWKANELLLGVRVSVWCRDCWLHQGVCVCV